MVSIKWVFGMHVLVVKITSMGDLIHLMPALSDAASYIPDIRFTWVVDKAFAEIPHWHPSVQATIKSDHRRWKKDWMHFYRSGQLKAFTQELRNETFDYVIDAQSSIKSAIVTRMARGPRHGMDKLSVREGFAQTAYQHRYYIPKKMHAISRLRLLFSKIFRYDLVASPADFQLNIPDSPEFSDLENPYLVCVRNASWPTKLWQDYHWQTLFALTENKFQIKLPTGNDEEYETASRLAQTFRHVEALPRKSLNETAALIKSAKGVVSTDTGLGHIAAALSVPCVSLYGPTDTALIGALGENQTHWYSDELECRPCYRKTCNYFNDARLSAHCMDVLTPEDVWEKLSQLMSNIKTQLVT